nr:glycosyl hydrolase [Terriglobales bacterium]
MKQLAWAATVLLLLGGVCTGQVYSTLNSGTTENLRGVSAASPLVVWASGTHGTYLRTTDSGNTWTVRQVPGAEALDFRDVEAFGSNLAYLLSAGPGDQSRIYKTRDGGRTWVLQFTNREPTGFLD